MLSNLNPEEPPLPVIFGIEGEKLTAAEKKFFKEVNPTGFILFKRNCKDPKQLKKLTADLQKILGREVPILIDQEGGRVQRMCPPEWKQYEPMESYGDDFLRDFSKGRKALQEVTQSMSAELVDAGINVNCAPVLDVQFPETHQAIGDRAFSNDPEVVSILGITMSEEFLKHGIVPVIKHLPGQGRANQDSHKDLPVVTAELKDLRKADFEPFRELLTKAFSEAVWGMVSHIIYQELDERAPASCSRRVIHETIRGDIGFKGLLLSDDISMGALDSIGNVAQRAEKVLRSGCDIALHCNGDLEEMKAIAQRLKHQKMTNEAVMRYNRTVEWLQTNLKP